jgi:hypothetical protein
MPTRMLAFACAAAAAALISAPSLAAEHAHPDHGTPAGLTLDQGRKWPTDEPLRQGMDRARAVMEEALPAIHANRAMAVQYGELAAAVRKDVAYIVANCRLAPDADAILHLVIAELLAGADAMEAKGANPEAGADKVMQALDDYGHYFDHPGWQLLDH